VDVTHYTKELARPIVVLWDISAFDSDDARAFIMALRLDCTRKVMQSSFWIGAGKSFFKSV